MIAASGYITGRCTFSVDLTHTSSQRGNFCKSGDTMYILLKLIDPHDNYQNENITLQ